MKKLLFVLALFAGLGLSAQTLDNLKVFQGQENVRIGSSKMQVYSHMAKHPDYVEKSHQIKFAADVDYGDGKVKYEKLAYWNDKSKDLMVFLFCNDKLYHKTVYYYFPLDQPDRAETQMKMLNNYVQSHPGLGMLSGKPIIPIENTDENLEEKIYRAVQEDDKFAQVSVGRILAVDVEPIQESDNEASVYPQFWLVFADFVDLAPVILTRSKGYPIIDYPVFVYGEVN
ncbi:MAG: hypothetical protein LPK80_12330 [Bacteroidota bacterium]|nr:hypothetical protein [Bacteroidota bacterium]MDX5428403.1 hypothetical protein [Bacteroidota bacterium]MDX5506174.1 hypothetical protein [Bacteroidota bacterium]